MRFRKVCSISSDLQRCSGSLKLAPLDRTNDFLLVFHCTSIFYTVSKISYVYMTIWTAGHAYAIYTKPNRYD